MSNTSCSCLTSRGEGLICTSWKLAIFLHVKHAKTNTRWYLVPPLLLIREWIEGLERTRHEALNAFKLDLRPVSIKAFLVRWKRWADESSLTTNLFHLPAGLISGTHSVDYYLIRPVMNHQTFCSECISPSLNLIKIKLIDEPQSIISAAHSILWILVSSAVSSTMLEELA